MGGDGDFNRAKLESTFGPRKVDDGLKLIDAEGQMSQNFADIVRNSKTAQSQQAAKLIENNQKYFKVDGGLTGLGALGKVSAGAGNFLLKTIAGRVSLNASDALAKALSGNKATSQELLNAINKTKNVSLKDKTLIRAILFSGAAQASQAQP
jgi:hypothetical protein